MPTIIPATEIDTDAFLRLPTAERQRVDSLVRCFREIQTGRRGKLQEALSQATEGRLAHLGLSAERLRKLYGAWRKQGWRSLVRRYKTNRTRLSPQFIQYWKMLLERHQRDTSGRSAYAMLASQYRAWLAGDSEQAIPGLGVTPPRPLRATGMPAGMTYRNLMNHQPSLAEKVTARRGRQAAKEYMPAVRRTRVGLLPGQVYTFDDAWHNNLVIFPGQAAPVRPIELAAIDVASGSKVIFGLQPRIVTESGARANIKEEDMGLLVVTLLRTKGFHPQGSLLIVEGGTATIRKAMAERITAATGGVVRVQVGGTDRTPAFLGDWMGPSKGCPRLKAGHESHHNLQQNRLGWVPGQVGKDRDHTPGSLTARTAETSTLIKIAARMDADLAAQMPLDFPSLAEYMQVCFDTYDAIDARTEHNLEGYAANGWVTAEIPGLPREALRQMPANVVEAMIAELANTPGGLRTRNLSPREVWEKHAPRLKRISAQAVPFIMGEEYWTRRLVTDRAEIEFTHKGTPHAFLAELQTEDGHPYLLKRGREYLTFFNPFSPESLCIIGDDGKFLGECPASPVSGYLDQTGINAQLGQVGRLLADARHTVGFRGAPIARQQLANNEQRVALIKEALARLPDAPPPAKAQSQPIKTGLRITEKDVDDLLSTPAPEPVTAAGNGTFEDDFNDI